MPHSTVRKTVLALGLISGLCRGQQREPDSATYAFFLQKVALLHSGEPFVLNGRDLEVTQPSIQQAIGLTDSEAEALHKLAFAFLAKIRALDETPKGFIFGARLRLMDSAVPERERARLRQQLDEIEDRHEEIIRSSVEELRAQLGEVRFQVVQSYIRSRNITDFFRPIARK